ncbi:hypothetical protein ACFU0X_10245 [Streptomyces cellulosae]|uniref:Uncharacterized protein n=1 Tax=Streptomyces cellulosae TaxID=1968 RepID=A0ABW6JDH8_STRCE
MTTEPREEHSPIVPVEKLTEALEALGARRGDGPMMSRAATLGALLFTVEQLLMFDVDRVELAEVRSGYVNMALMAGMSMSGDDLPAGVLVPALEFSADNWENASFVFARLVENRLNRTRLDLEEMAAPHDPEKFNLAEPLVGWLRAVSALMPMVNAEVSAKDVERAGKAAKRHAGEARQALAALLKLASE